MSSQQEQGMFEDTKIVQAEQQAFSGAKDFAITTFNAQSNQNKMVIIVAIIILIGLVIWFIGRTIVGFMSTPMGMLLIVLTIVSVGVYLYMRSKGIGFKSASGGFVEVLLIMFVLMVYVGCLDVLTNVFLQIFPVLLLGMMGWVGYKWWKSTDSQSDKQGVAIIVVCILVGFPLFQAFVVPYTTGQPLSINAEVTRDDTGKWFAYIEMSKFTFIQSMSTQLNPYAISMVETSTWMWSSGNTAEKAYVDITVYRESPPEVIFSETRKSVYVGHSDSEGIWAIARMPVESIEHYVPYQVSIRVYDEGQVTLAGYSFVFRTD